MYLKLLCELHGLYVGRVYQTLHKYQLNEDLRLAEKLICSEADGCGLRP